MPKFKIKDFPNTVWETLEESSVHYTRCSVIKHTSDIQIPRDTPLKTPHTDTILKLHSTMENLEKMLSKENKEYMHKKFKYAFYENGKNKIP